MVVVLAECIQRQIKYAIRIRVIFNGKLKNKTCKYKQTEIIYDICETG